MKTYIDCIDYIRYEGMQIPKEPLNVDYALFLNEQRNGEAELIPYVPPPPTWDEIKFKRENLLKESDWSVLADSTPKPNKEAWLNYRQALRNIPQDFSTPESVVWPTKPS